MCNSEPVFCARSAAVLAASSASLEPSVAKRILVGKMLILRRVMHNCSDQEVGQVAQRSPELVVEPLPAGVGCHLGRQAGQKTTQRLGLVALQGEEVL